MRLLLLGNQQDAPIWMDVNNGQKEKMAEFASQNSFMNLLMDTKGIQPMNQEAQSPHNFFFLGGGGGGGCQK